MITIAEFKKAIRQDCVISTIYIFRSASYFDIIIDTQRCNQAFNDISNTETVVLVSFNEELVVLHDRIYEIKWTM